MPAITESNDVCVRRNILESLYNPTILDRWFATR
jgi:hypothetical protein